MNKLDVKDFSSVHLTILLLLHYLINVKFRSRSLDVYYNKFTMGNACVGSEMIN